MSIRAVGGTTALDRLRGRLELRCRECGYDDDGGRWTAATSGAEVTYQHICPSCGAVRQRTFRLDRRS